MVRERTQFETRAEQVILDGTQRLLAEIDREARRFAVSDGDVHSILVRFGGDDLAECWLDYLESGEADA